VGQLLKPRTHRAVEHVAARSDHHRVRNLREPVLDRAASAAVP
jgi:hypothetical protein